MVRTKRIDEVLTPAYPDRKEKGCNSFPPERRKSGGLREDGPLRRRQL
jgi:hypothetical protein